MLWENVKLAMNGLRSNKMRAFLTMLGIIIGISAVIAIMTVGNSLTYSVSSSMQSLGVNNITVGLKQKSQTDTGSDGMTFDMSRRRTSYSEKDYITDEMLENLEQTFSDSISAIALSETVGSGTADREANSANISVTGINDGYKEVEEINLLSGRDFAQRDYEEGKRVALVSDKLVEQLFGGDNRTALGSSLETTVNGQYGTYTIVGIYEYEESSMGFSSSSDADVTTNFYIPLETAKVVNHSDEGYTTFTAVTSAGTDSTSLAEEIETFLNRYYRNNEDYEVSTFSMESMVSTMMDTIGTIQIAISVIAGISLLVGGIGVMNIMLVSITERTKEIGTRKALGASNSSIRIQFIVESIIICLFGGMIGIALGILLGSFGTTLLGYSAQASVGSIMMALGFSTAIGIFFGYYPANKAAKMDPIDALRYE